MTARKAVTALAVIGAAAFMIAQAQDRRPPGPADIGQTDRGVRFQSPKVPPVAPRQAAPLRVGRFEVNELAEGTHVGSPGDLLLTLQGQGFLETAKAPRVEIGGKLVFDDTMVGRDGTQLFVVLPRQRVAEVDKLQFDQIVIRNPGARENTEFARATVKASPADIRRPAAGAARARLVFRAGAFERELVQR